MRDEQRERVYEAEWRLQNMLDTADRISNRMVTLDGIALTLPTEYKFASVPSVQRYCDEVCDRRGWRPVRVRERKGQHKAHYQLGEIAVPMVDRWALREVVILHELAHHATPGGHGPQFVGALANLLDDVMAPEAGLAYRLLCQHNGVKIG